MHKGLEVLLIGLTVSILGLAFFAGISIGLGTLGYILLHL